MIHINMMKKIKYTFTFLIALTAFLSCDKGTEHKDLYPHTAYFTSKGVPCNKISGDVISLSLKHASIGKKEYKSAVNITRTKIGNTVINAVIDTTLIKSYAQAELPKGIRAIPLPDGMFLLKKNSVTVKTGETASQDSLILSVDPSKFNSKFHDGVFVVPVALREGKGIKISKNRSVIYYIFNTLPLTVDLKILGDPGEGKFKQLLIRRNGTKNTYTGNQSFRFGANLNNNVENDLKCNLTINNSLVEKFNKDFHKNYISFPEGSVAFKGDEVTFKKGTNVQDKILELEIKDPSLFTNTEQLYLLPIQISYPENEGSPFIDERKNTVYFEMTVALNNIEAKDVTGTQIDRSKIKGFKERFYDDDPEKVLDGDENTAWAAEYNSKLCIDLQAKHTIKGFTMQPRMFPGTTTYLCVPQIIDVYASDTVNDFKYVGTYYGEDVAIEQLRCISFVKPVTGRYFKFDFKKTHDGNVACVAELMVFE